MLTKTVLKSVSLWQRDAHDRHDSEGPEATARYRLLEAREILTDGTATTVGICAVLLFGL